MTEWRKQFTPKFTVSPVNPQILEIIQILDKIPSNREPRPTNSKGRSWIESKSRSTKTPLTTLSYYSVKTAESENGFGWTGALNSGDVDPANLSGSAGQNTKETAHFCLNKVHMSDWRLIWRRAYKRWYHQTFLDLYYQKSMSCCSSLIC